MSDQAPASSGSSAGGGIIAQFTGHLFDMPRWHKMAMVFFALVAGAGLTGKVMDLVGGDTGAVPAAQTSGAGRSVVSGGDTGSGSESDDVKGSALSRERSFQGWLVRNSPWLTRVGMGFVAGFIIGWIFRAFIKLMTMITLIGAALFAGLTYFRVIDVDLSKAQHQYEDATAWVSDQGSKLKDAALAHIPAGMSSFAGMFVGFLRKK